MSSISWRKSSFSACNGNCLESAWVAARCNNGSCIEASLCACEGRDQVWVRDSKLGDASPILKFSVADWWSILAAIKSRLITAWSGVLQVAVRDGGWVVCHRDEPDVVLRFAAGEVAAFRAGVEAGEFDVVALSVNIASARSVPPLAAVEPSPVHG